MKYGAFTQIGIILFLMLFSATSMAGDHGAAGEPCIGYGP